jgi:iron complex outermembrane receptor protein
MKRKAAGCVVGLFLMNGYAGAGTESSPVFTMGEVEVKAKALGPLPTRRILTSVDVLGQDLIRSQNVKYGWELYNQFPGVQLTQFGQGNVSGKLSFRAFNGEAEINAVKLLIDGIPSNSNDGNMPYMDMVFPGDIASIEVVRGTNDARYGLHNIAGNTNINTRIGGNEGVARLSYGSFNSREAQVGKGFEGEHFSQNYFVAKQRIAGYRNHANSDRTAVSGKWFYSPGNANTRAGLIVRHYEGQADEPGYLTQAQAYSDPVQSPAHNASDTDNRIADQVSLHLEGEAGADRYWTIKAYQNHLDDRRWVKFSANVSQQERYVSENHSGILSNMTWRPAVGWAKSFALEGGISAEWQKNHSDRYNTVNRARTAHTRNQDFDFDTYGGYVQAVVQWNEQLKMIPAFRVDNVLGSYTNQLNATTYGINHYGAIKQPKLSFVYAPTTAYSLYGNWGKTFQVGVGTASYKVGQATDLQPSINTGWETGLKLNPAEGYEGRIALWQQVATNEARRKLNDPNNASENIGNTRRRGLDIQASAQLTRLRVWGGWAYQDSRILQADASAPLSQDKEIDHVPRRIISAGADYAATPELKLSLTANLQSDYYLERTNSLTGKFGSYTLFNAAANYSLRPDIALNFQIKNLTNRYSEYVWYDNTQSLHAPGNKRAYYLSSSFQF